MRNTGSITRLCVFPLLLAGLAVALSSCSHKPSTTQGPSTRGFSAGLDANESPMLAALVKAGELPPLKDRLPEDPIVVKPLKRPGTYGGTWHMVHSSPDFPDIKMVVFYAPLIRWKQDSNGVEPGLAKSWAYSDGGRTLTLHLRKGLKWSDGKPYTSEDFGYYYSLCTSGRLRLTPPGWCIVKGKPMKVECPDSLTIVMRFAGPNFFAHLQLATGFWVPEEYSIPKHYMKQFDPNYNHKYKDYVIFERRNITHLNPERPTMCPWRFKGLSAGGSRAIFERNPYCAMVDTLGRQLPYIDRVESNLVLDRQLKLLRMLAGEVDCQWRAIDITDLGLFMRGQKRGDYRIKLWKEGSGAMSAVLVNWDQPDPVLRKIMRDKRFRRALAYAIPRDTINLVVYRGMAHPQNSVISAQSWHFKTPEGHALYEKWRRLYSEFDPRRSNALLDQMGLKRGASGWRMRPDGKPLQLLFTVASASESKSENDEVMMISDQWRKLGIKVIVTTPPAAEISNRLLLGRFDINMMGESEMDLFTYPSWVFPTDNNYWHPLTGKWYATGGKQGKAPEGAAADLLKIYDRIKGEPDLAKCHGLVLDAVRIHIKEGPFTLGTVGDTPGPVLVKNSFHNVPDTGVTGPWAVSQPAASYPEQFFISSGGAR